MKWFHHECAARHDPKLQVLGSTHGAEGIGIYWGLLEEIGQHSDTFHLKVMGINPETDQNVSDFLRYPQSISEHPFGPSTPIASFPRLPVKILSKNLFTSTRKLQSVIAFCVEAGLFDARKWLEFNVLYSPSFEHRADDYTRRTKRGTNTVRTIAEHTSENVRTISEQSTNILRTTSELSSNNVRLETDTEVEQNRNTNRTERKMPVKISPDVDKSSNGHSKPPSTGDRREADESYLIEPSEDIFDEYSLRFHSILQQWNKENSAHSIDWHPSTLELKKLFYSGEYPHKLSMCFHAYKLLGEKINYPELILRALSLLLSTNAKGKIDNPFGWMWTCLHGNGNGTKPWVQLITASEENSINSQPRRK